MLILSLFIGLSISEKLFEEFFSVNNLWHTRILTKQKRLPAQLIRSCSCLYLGSRFILIWMVLLYFEGLPTKTATRSEFF